MNRRKKETERIVENHLGLFDSPPAEDIAASRDRTLERLRSAAADPKRDFSSPHASRRAVGPFKLIAVAAVLVLAIALPWIVNRKHTLAVLESAQQQTTDDVPTAGAQIAASDPVRTSPEAGRVLELSDGSTIEIRSNSELSVDRADDGLRIHLTRGDVIVNAAKQQSGHLYVQTEDLQARVAGTVFLVSATKEGSRVAVIEGDVRVRQGATEKQLLPGEEVTTSPLLKPAPLREEIAWSHSAPAHLALLQQSTPLRTTTPVPGLETKETFEVDSVRIGLPPPPGTGVRGGAGPNGCAGGVPPQIDPKRFATTNKYVYTLIAWAFFGNFGPCQNVSVLNLIQGGPSWIKSDQYTIEATIPDGVFSTTPTLRDPKLGRMLQSLLEDRFKLVTHRETKVMDVYVMTFEGDPAQFTDSQQTYWLTQKPADWSSAMEERQGLVAQEKGPTARGPEYRGFFYGANATMAEIAPLIGRLTGRPVLERAGLTAKFNYYFEYSVDSPPNNSPIGGPLNPGERSSIISEMQKQMGIKLEPSRAPVETLVIDHVEKPSEN
jgi:uncharacterized protein (TIGR03435 family)